MNPDSSKFKKLRQAIWAREHLQIGARYLQTFSELFDSVFGGKHWSWLCLRRSIVSTTVFVVTLLFIPDLLLTALWAPSQLWPVLQYRGGTVAFLVLPIVAVTFFPDYLSLWVTRKLIGLASTKNVFIVVLIFVLDFFLTTVICVGPALILSAKVLPVLNLGLLSETAIPLPSFTISDQLVLYTFLSGYFTSFWWWLQVLGTILAQILVRIDRAYQTLRSLLDIEKRPLSSMSRVLLMSYGVVALPLVLFAKNNPPMIATRCALGFQLGAEGVCESGKELQIPTWVPKDRMIWIPQGEFYMGCNESLDNQCGENEKSGHMVYLDGYAIDKKEVTVEEYKLCVERGKCSEEDMTDSFCTWHSRNHPLNQKYPINCVQWQQARDYCVWWGEYLGIGQMRLPSEAEWEKAARGTDRRVYPWGNEEPLCERVQFSRCNGFVVEVGSKPGGTSPYGLYDMSGNVWEWVEDCYDSDIYKSRNDKVTKNPLHSPNRCPSGRRVLRGGSFVNNARGLRASYRNWYGVNGFRCVLSAQHR